MLLSPPVDLPALRQAMSDADAARTAKYLIYKDARANYLDAKEAADGYYEVMLDKKQDYLNGVGQDFNQGRAVSVMSSATSTAYGIALEAKRNYDRYVAIVYNPKINAYYAAASDYNSAYLAWIAAKETYETELNRVQEVGMDEDDLDVMEDSLDPYLDLSGLPAVTLVEDGAGLAETFDLPGSV